MDAASYLGLEARGDGRFQVPLGPQLVTPGDFLYGGCGLSLCVEALEQTTGTALRWAACQFVSYAELGDVLELEVEVAAAGRRVTQARVTARCEGREVLTTMAALGEGRFSTPGLLSAPEVPGPLDCQPRSTAADLGDSLFSRLESRVVVGRSWDDLDGTPGGTRIASWLRLPAITTSSAAVLAIFSDHVAGGITQVTGELMTSRSLDNTLRICEQPPTGWVLVDVSIEACVDGFVQGQAHLWSEDGRLLGMASQTQTTRPRPEGELPPMWGGRRSGA
jgi:acyl-CoA thioesterase